MARVSTPVATRNGLILAFHEHSLAEKPIFAENIFFGLQMVGYLLIEEQVFFTSEPIGNKPKDPGRRIT